MVTSLLFFGDGFATCRIPEPRGCVPSPKPPAPVIPTFTRLLLPVTYEMGTIVSLIVQLGKLRNRKGTYLAQYYTAPKNIDLKPCNMASDP